MSTIEQERTIYAKLEAMKDVRSKTIHLEKMKLKIIREVENGDAEEKCLAEYRREMEMLLQEKMSHVEELRQIHADINAMESVIKQAEENRLRALNVANRLHDDYIPLKAEVDHMRREYLGLERLPELHEEEGSIVTPDRFQNFYSGKLGHNTGTSSFNRPPLNTHSISANQDQSPGNNNTGSGGGGGGGGGSAGTGGGSAGGQSQFLAPTPVNPIRSTPLQSLAQGSNVSKPDLTANRLPQTHAINIGHPTFRSEFLRQQPPPMKSCLSCHQQIHRNAPICPLCKAKSRSRNPKKPKKKEQ